MPKPKKKGRGQRRRRRGSNSQAQAQPEVPLIYVQRPCAISGADYSKYLRQLRQSQGFDVDDFPGMLVVPVRFADDDDDVEFHRLEFYADLAKLLVDRHNAKVTARVPDEEYLDDSNCFYALGPSIFKQAGLDPTKEPKCGPVKFKELVKATRCHEDRLYFFTLKCVDDKDGFIKTYQCVGNFPPGRGVYLKLFRMKPDHPKPAAAGSGEENIDGGQSNTGSCKGTTFHDGPGENNAGGQSSTGSDERTMSQGGSKMRSDGKELDADLENATVSNADIRVPVIEHSRTHTEISHPNIKHDILAKVKEYCNKHKDDAVSNAIELKAWDAQFLNKVDKTTLADLSLAAHKLNIRGLMDLTGRTMAEIWRAESEGTTDKFRI